MSSTDLWKLNYKFSEKPQASNDSGYRKTMTQRSKTPNTLETPRSNTNIRSFYKGDSTCSTPIALTPRETPQAAQRRSSFVRGFVTPRGPFVRNATAMVTYARENSMAPPQSSTSSKANFFTKRRISINTALTTENHTPNNESHSMLKKKWNNLMMDRRPKSDFNYQEIVSSMQHVETEREPQLVCPFSMKNADLKKAFWSKPSLKIKKVVKRIKSVSPNGRENPIGGQLSSKESENLKDKQKKLKMKFLANAENMLEEVSKMQIPKTSFSLVNSPQGDIVKINLKQEPQKDLSLDSIPDDNFEKYIHKADEINVVKDLIEGDNLKKRKVTRQRVMETIHHIRSIKLTPQEFADHKLNKGAYNIENSKTFFMAVKMNDTKTVKRMLHSNKLLAYDHDNLKETALHWAAKRNNAEIIDLLVQSGADVDFKDMSGRTPLYVSCKLNNVEAVKHLLAARANPFLMCNRNMEPRDVATDLDIHRFIDKSKLFYVIGHFSQINRRESVWETEGKEYFLKKNC